MEGNQQVHEVSQHHADSRMGAVCVSVRGGRRQINCKLYVKIAACDSEGYIKRKWFGVVENIYLLQTLQFTCFHSW